MIGGDGTGPEVTAEGVKVLKAVAGLEGIKYELKDFDLGGITLTFDPNTRRLINSLWIDSGQPEWQEESIAGIMPTVAKEERRKPETSI